MKKVLIIGCPGSGKTHLTKRLSHKTGLPVIHLDKTYHKLTYAIPDKAIFKEEWRAWVGEQIERPSWIIDGNHKGTFDIRMPAADTIIFLDYPRWLVLWRAFKRRIQYRNRLREDMPSGWKERISSDFLSFIWNYRKVERPKVLSLLESYGEEKKIKVFRHPREAENYLRGLT